jgi:hypothetical protein
MTLRHILEYEDHEIQDLMGDLDSVGQMKSLQGTLWAHFTTYKLDYKLDDDYWTSNPEIMCFLKTEPFFATGDHYHVDRDESIMLQKIQNGAFTRVLDPDARSYMSLKVGNPAAMEILEKSNIQALANTCTTIDQLTRKISQKLIEAQKTELTKAGQLMKTVYPHNLDAAANVLVYGFIAPVGSPYLKTFDMYKPFVKGAGINHKS